LVPTSFLFEISNKKEVVAIPGPTSEKKMRSALFWPGISKKKEVGTLGPGNVEPSEKRGRHFGHSGVFP
jgi:hypothetical protein